MAYKTLEPNKTIRKNKLDALEEKVLNMRMNEFGFQKVAFWGSDQDVFPFKINIVKWEKCDPRKVFSVDLNDYILSTSYCFVIGTLEWNSKEPCWEFSSVGTRYLEFGTDELNKWIMGFCERHEILDGMLRGVKN